MDSPVVDEPEIFDYNNIHLIIHRIDASFLLWCDASRQFHLLEEPVYFVLQSIFQSKSKDDIAELCSRRYDSPLPECAAFVEEISQFVNSLKTEYLATRNNREAPTQISTIQFYSIVSYQFGHKLITLRYSDDSIQQCFHPLLSPNQSQKPSDSGYIIDLYKEKGQFVIVDKFSRESWPQTDVPHFKGAVLGRMLNIIYDKDDADWLMTMHASGVSNGKHSVLFSAAAGCGKSTISALMQAQGYDLLSDDFIAVDQGANAYRFPLSLSVKEGAFEVLSGYYPQLGNIPPCVAGNGKSVRFLPPELPKSSLSAFPVKAIVFVRYDENLDFDFRATPHAEAVKLLLPEVFVHPILSTVYQFMKWISQIQFYTLSYSDSQKAIEAINKVFRDE